MSEENDKVVRTPEEIDAYIKEKLANSEKLLQEGEAARALVLKTLEETRKVAAEAEVAEIAKAAALRKEKNDLAADDLNHVYYFSSGVDDSTVKACIKQLNIWDRTETPGHIDFVIDSPGGGVIAGMALFDALVNMRNRGWDITTIARGYAASMGGILLQAGTTRRVGKESYILIHEISTAAIGKVSEMEDEVNFMKKIQERVLDIFVERAAGKITKATLRNKWKKTDFWLDSADALKWGIVDEIG